MALYCLTCIDKPNSLDLRMANREAHLAYIREQGETVCLGGPFLDEDGGMAGSMLLIESPDLAGARAFNAADPYTKAGLWAQVDIRAYRATVGTLVG